jgi:hypothetical protein
MALIPSIGTSGIFQLQAPFAAHLVAGAPYTCMAVRRLADIIQLGFDPYEQVYQPYGLTQDIYNANVLSDVCIVSLQSSSGVWLYVPSSYILSYPDMGGVPYTSLVLGVSLGPIPNHLNLAALKQRIIDDVKDFVGITATVTTVAVSETEMIAQATSTAIEAARVAQITATTTDRTKLITALAQKTALQAKVTELEDYIKANLPP